MYMLIKSIKWEWEVECLYLQLAAKQDTEPWGLFKYKYSFLGPFSQKYAVLRK